MTTLRGWLLTLALTVFCGWAAWGAEVNAATGMLDRAAALAPTATTNDYPDAETVLLAGITRVRYEPDGTYTQWQEEYVKILTEPGRESYRMLSSYFTIPYQRGPEDCQIALVEIVRPDGASVMIDVAAQGRVMVDPSAMEKNIYNPNDKILQVNVPGLEVGDILHTIFFDRTVHPRMTNTWCDWIVFESTRPILHQVAEIDAPAALPLCGIALKSPVGDTVRYTVTNQGERVLHRWEARNVPRAFPEPNMPDMHTVVQRVLVSTTPDWEQVSRWYWALSSPHYTPTPDINAKVEALTRGKTLDADKIQALFSFVAQEVRYMGIVAESESPGYEPHDVADTFAARHGVCRDKAALLVVMLRAAGLEAFPTLIQKGPKKDPEVPQPYFNHAIVAVRNGATYLLMDPTDETTRELLPSYLDNCSYLVATPAGDPLRVSPIEPAEKNLMHVDTIGSVTADGRLNAETELTFAGVNDNIYRQYFAQLQEQERRRLLEGVVKQAVPNARVRSVVIAPADMLDVSTGLSARITFDAEDIMVRGDTLAMLPLPLLGTRLGMLNFVIGKTGLQERRFPLLTEVACGVRERLILDLDPALNTPVSLPAAEPRDGGGVVWGLSVQQSGGQLSAVSEFRLEAVEFDPAQYRNLKDTLVTIERAQRQMPVYALGGPAADALAVDNDVIIESEVVRYSLESVGVWSETRTVRKRVLTYAGLKRSAELKIAFNPAWDEVELVQGVVTAPDGSRSEISPAEINLMDAPWVGSTPRYPAQRTLVASFPAVAVGSTIDYTLVTRRKDRPFVSFHESFRRTDPIRHKRVTVEVARGALPDIYRSRFEGARITEAIFTDAEGERDAYEWEAHDVPGVKREDRQPPDWVMHPTVTLSFGRWRTYAETLDKTLRRAAARQPEAAALARALTADLVDPWERLRVLRDAVATRVRLAGPALPDLPLAALSPADQTLAEGYGNQADRAVLLYAMLRAAGFAPTFVVASSRPAIAPFRAALDEAAEREVFGDVLVRVDDAGLDLADGRLVYLGDDDQYGAVGASEHAGVWTLQLPSGEIAPLRPARDDTQWVEDAFWLDPNGDARLTRRILFYGAAFGAENRRLAQMTPEERRRDFLETLGGISQAATGVGDLIADFTRYPGRVEFSARLPQFAVREGSRLHLTLPQTFERAFALRSDERLTPIYLDDRGTLHVRVTAHLPQGFRTVMHPAAVDLSGAAGSSVSVQVSEESTDEGAVWMLQGELAREPAIVPPSDYPTLLQWARLLAHRRARTLLMDAAPVE